MTEKKPLILYQNYDLYKTLGPDEGPGTRQERLEKLSPRQKQKKRIKKRKAQLIQYLLSSFAKEDVNNLTDPYEGTMTPIPFAPAEPSPTGLLDGMTPQATDEDGHSFSNLYYGISEERQMSDSPSINTKKEPKSKPPANNSTSMQPKKSAK